MRDSAGLRRGTEVLAFLACMVVLAALGLAVFSALRSNSAAVERSTSLDPATVANAALLADVVDQESALRAYLLTANVHPHLQKYDSSRAKVPNRFSELQHLLADFDVPTMDLRRVETAYYEWLNDVAEPQIAAMSSGNELAAIGVEGSGESRRLFEGLRDRFAELTQAITVEQTETFHQVENSTRILLSSLAASVLVIVGVVVAIVIALRHWLLSPIDAMRRAVNAVSAGRYDTQIPAVGPPEIVQLAYNLEAMRAELVRLVRQNERSWEALAQEGPAVVALRDALTPSTLHAPGLVLRGRVDPADGELAGDWYDSFDLPDGRVGVIVGDVSGHGAAAGVFALRLKQLLGAALVTGASPSEAVEWAVESLGETDEMFATAVVAVVDPDVGQLSYANAGHPDALLLRRSVPAVAVPAAINATSSVKADSSINVNSSAGASSVGANGSVGTDRVDAHRTDAHRTAAHRTAAQRTAAQRTAANRTPGQRTAANRPGDDSGGYEPGNGAARRPAAVRIDALGATGPLISALVATPDAWETKTVRLVPGDVLFLYTDGLIEARNAQGRQFGQEGLVNAFLRDSTRLPGELLDDVFDAVRRHSPGRAADDRTALVLARTETFVSLRRRSAADARGRR